ncbi:MAG: hypothetical protein ACI9UN_002968 [Granulosicoccus sp.]|jgi:hypothetical protein
MSKPESERNDQGNLSMFDFLSEDTDGQGPRASAARKSKHKVMPVIRKPIPVSKSGPLLPPKPGDPVEPPPALTTGVAKKSIAGVGKKAKISDDLDFLDETRADLPDLRPANTNKTRLNNLDNVRPIHRVGTSDEQQNLEQEFLHLGPQRKRKPNSEFEFETDWRAGHASYEDVAEENSIGWLRWILPVFALVIFSGGGMYAYTAGYFNELIASSDAEFVNSSDRVGLQLTDAPAVSQELASPNSVEIMPAATALDSPIVAIESTLFVRFRSQLAAIESMIENGSLKDAELALINMDRSVYGYGVAEFSALENQIATSRRQQVSGNDGAELAEAERVEQLRLTNEAVLVAEQLQQDARNAAAAAAETSRLEQVLFEAEKARVAQARIDSAEVAAAAESARLEQALFEAKKAQQAQAKSNADKAVEAQLVNETTQLNTSATQGRLEISQEQLAARNADKIRLDALEEVAREEPRRQMISADRLATDRQIAEERAAAERRAARGARFGRAREIEAAKAAAAASVPANSSGIRAAAGDQQLSSPQAIAQPLSSESNSQASVVTQPLTISDDELQTVYRRFTALQNAISNRDISTVIKLTERSGLRVQQFMQIFENSVGIDIRIRNVSTSNATGEINGTLQIRSIKRNDGSLAAPPADLASIKVKTKREGDDWSVIRW